MDSWAYFIEKEDFMTECNVEIFSEEASAYLSKSFDAMGLSARAYDRILKVARTIADLKGNNEIQKDDIGAALRFRSLDRKYWE